MTAGSVRRCIVCGGESHMRFLPLDRAVIACCALCGHGRTLRVHRHVGPESYGQHAAARATYERKYLPARRESWERGLALLGQPSAGSRLLDVGTSYGHFVVEARQRGWDAYGIEEGDRARELAVRGASGRIHASLREVAEPATFEVITLWDVLEHVADPQTFLSELVGRLSEDGQLLVRVPDARALPLARGYYLTLCHPTNPEEHPHHYTPHSLSLTAAAAGLSMGAMVESGPGERVAAGRGAVDEAVRRALHRRHAGLPYEFTTVLAR
jgi:2-polyprenyl-3-methyl-5-hydroxy-6-metoxy-1,4-benzoquinol methylase